MNDAAYRAIDATNWSKLKSMRISPRQYAHDLQHDKDDTPAMRIGRAAHAFLLEPDAFEREYVCYRGERRGKAWADFAAAHAHQTILTLTEWERALTTACAINADPHAREFLRIGLKEAAVTWTDSETGLACKGRVDLAGVHLAEIKTTAVIEPYRFAALAARLGYHIQAAFYLDGLAANGLSVDPEPVLVVVQSEPPHDVCVYRFAVHTVDVGRAEYRRLLQLLKRCRERNEWPGVSPEVRYLELPEYVYQQDSLELTVGGQRLEWE